MINVINRNYQALWKKILPLLFLVILYSYGIIELSKHSRCKRGFEQIMLIFYYLKNRKKKSIMLNFSIIVWSKIEAPWPWNMLLEFFLSLYPETMFKEISPYVPHQNVGNPRYWPPCPPGGYIPLCQKLIISEYNHLTPLLKGNFMLNRNQAVKSSKNHYFDCFNLF